jgi:hypothetical protein
VSGTRHRTGQGGTALVCLGNPGKDLVPTVPRRTGSVVRQIARNSQVALDKTPKIGVSPPSDHENGFPIALIRHKKPQQIPARISRFSFLKRFFQRLLFHAFTFKKLSFFAIGAFMKFKNTGILYIDMQIMRSSKSPIDFSDQ